ncbi:hypothetical protein HYX00_03260 [Candidatus Woesearchaeota archaeon]|nr:hypothetical protein [Candidatus Woesearchaeota archaeon]
MATEYKEMVRVKNYQFVSGRDLKGIIIPATALMDVSVDGGIERVIADGAGQMDAMVKALNQTTPFRVDPPYIIRLTSNSVTGGSNGEIVVRMEVSHKGRTYYGKGRSIDQTEATMYAYVEALNKILMRARQKK